MAQQVKRFAVTVPAGTAIATPQVTKLTLGTWNVDELEIVVPPGPRGEVGFALGLSGQPVIPYQLGTYIVTDNETIRWPLEDFPDSGDWQATCYNTGLFPHTLEFRFLLSLPRGLAPSASPLIPSDQLLPAAGGSAQLPAAPLLPLVQLPPAPTLPPLQLPPAPTLPPVQLPPPPVLPPAQLPGPPGAPPQEDRPLTPAERKDIARALVRIVYETGAMREPESQASLSYWEQVLAAQGFENGVSTMFDRAGEFVASLQDRRKMLDDYRAGRLGPGTPTG